MRARLAEFVERHPGISLVVTVYGLAAIMLIALAVYARS